MTLQTIYHKRTFTAPYCAWPPAWLMFNERKAQYQRPKYLQLSRLTTYRKKELQQTHLAKSIRCTNGPENSARMGIEFSALFGYFLSKQKVTKKKKWQQQKKMTRKKIIRTNKAVQKKKEVAIKKCNKTKTDSAIHAIKTLLKTATKLLNHNGQ